MYIQAVIFDCDGTLVDTEEMWARLDVASFAELGIPFESPDAYQAEFMGVAKANTIAILNARYGMHISVDDFQRRFVPRVLDHIPTEMRVFPESLEAVRDLAAMGLRLAVASNGHPIAVKAEVSYAGYMNYIPDAHILSVTDAARPKPAPDLYLEAARRLNVDPGSCVVIEDSVPGALGGVAAGMTVLGYTGFAHDKKAAAIALENAGCAHIINDLREVIPFVTRKGLSSSEPFAKTGAD